MRKIVLICIVFIYLSAIAWSQTTVSGTFPALSNQQIKLVGFEGFNTYTIDSIKASEKGSFRLSFNQKDYGMGYLAAEDDKAFIVIIAPDENLQLEGESLASSQTVVIKSGTQNHFFGQYANEHVRRDQTLSAWDFLSKIYQQDTLFSIHQKSQDAIETEIKRLKQEDEAFLAHLDPETYVSWFLPVRKLVSSVATIAQYRTQEIPASIEAFRAMDYTDARLYKSGLLRETIEAHFWLIENSGRSLDSVFIEMNRSIDILIDKLVTDEKKFNEITAYLFKLLESRSLFASSEYLALKVLNEVSCAVNNDLAAQLESYRAMKKGNTAPDFAFEQDVIAPAYSTDKTPQKLSELASKYTLLVFGASWCPACPEELSKISGLYDKWSKYDIKVVFVSLDEDKQLFKSFAGGFPFISICDYNKWESTVVKAYHVFATPTLYLLDDKREIILRPKSVQHMDAWVDWVLVQGKK